MGSKRRLYKTCKAASKYQIDQSGKIEQTNKDTVIAYSDGAQYAVVIPKSDIVIDTEYPGKEKLITQFVHMLLQANQNPNHEITFARIGSEPRAHYAAKDVFDKKKKPDRILLLGDIIKALKKTDGRLKECLSTLVDAQSRSYVKRIPKDRRKVK